MTVVAVDPQADADDPRQVNLQAGEVYCSTEAVEIRTILGSCVAVCLVDPHTRTGGMNHYVLPRGSPSQSGLRYGDFAIDDLVCRMLALGCRVRDLRAKVFGGAAVLPFGSEQDTVGTRNVQVAVECLLRHSIPIVARRTGGGHGLLVRLHTATGHAMVRPIARSSLMETNGRIAINDLGGIEPWGSVGTIAGYRNLPAPKRRRHDWKS